MFKEMFKELQHLIWTRFYLCRVGELDVVNGGEDTLQTLNCSQGYLKTFLHEF